MNHESELAQARERLRRPPCWGPNEHGEYMVDMEVGAYESDLDRLVSAAASDLASALMDQHRAMCEYSLIEERSGMACTYTGRVFCHCGLPVTYGFDGDPTHHRGMCEHCDAVRCDAYPGACQ